MLEYSVVLLRLVQYVGAVLLLGVPLFFALRMPASDAAIERWPRTALIAVAVTTSVTAVVALLLQTAVMAGSLSEALKPESLNYVALGTGLGLGFVVRATAAAAMVILLLALRPGRLGWIILSVFGGVVCASLAWTGHGAATEGQAGLVHLGADVIHALAAGLWLGALAALAAVLAQAPGHREFDQLTHDALQGFAGLGTLAVGLLVASGLVNSWFLIGLDRLPQLLTTTYGILLLIKLALFGGMLAAAAANRFVLTPRLGLSLEDDARLPMAIRALRRSLVLESLLALMLLAVVAVMGTLAPPASMI